MVREVVEMAGTGRRRTSFPILLTGNVLHYIEQILFQLKQQSLKKTQITLKNPSGSGVSAYTRNDYLKLLEEYLHFIKHEEIGNVHRYQLADRGIEYLKNYELDRKEEALKIIHNSAYQGIIHYKFFFEFFKEKEKVKIDKNKNRTKELRNLCNKECLNEYGIEIFDDNDINSTYYLAKAIGLIEEIDADGHFICISDNYKLDFDWDSFIEAIREIMSPKRPRREFTKDLCERLFERREWFVRGEMVIEDILEIFKKLRLLKDANIGMINFRPAYPKPPIPYTHTIIEFNSLELKSPGGRDDGV